MPHPQNHYFYLAPIRGITDALFRTIYHHHFPYFNAAVAPFINPQRFTNLKPALLADILPENNLKLPIVPQLLYNNSEDFVNLGRLLQDLGYSHLNWNLGCPAPQIANKQRGSGLLPHTDRIIALLDAVQEHLSAEISIKTRLGLESSDDIEKLLPRLESTPLKEIIIHPRIGKQLYRGAASRENFGRCTELTSHRLVYNGDIWSGSDFKDLSAIFPGVHRWMLGRGAIANPLLAAEIQGHSVSPEQKRNVLYLFHNDLYEQLQDKLHGPGHLLGRMKQIWAYLISSFPGKEKSLKKIRKASSTSKYLEAVAEIFA